MITVEKADPRSPDARYLTEKLSAELAFITGDSGNSHFSLASLEGKRAVWAVARDSNGNATGCGAIRPMASDIAELKRMYSDRSRPGIGQALLTFLEACSRELGYREIWLETRRVNQKAVQFYERNGYVRIENYGPYVGREEAVCLAKSLSAG
ncbi:GNAT family N-acetyltransferase [Pantoea sp. KPR_PJ]|uniref:GNAT family N-acetyltransferase n=1 Tax=Pantoea sp. KPR_PJ TaxID=2738375 RepID=UPI003529A447